MSMLEISKGDNEMENKEKMELMERVKVKIAEIKNELHEMGYPTQWLNISYVQGDYCFLTMKDNKKIISLHLVENETGNPILDSYVTEKENEV